MFAVKQEAVICRQWKLWQ